MFWKSHIKFHIDDSDITLTFTQEESVGVKSVIFDTLAETYRKAGRF